VKDQPAGWFSITPLLHNLLALIPFILPVSVYKKVHAGKTGSKSLHPKNIQESLWVH
jgi:hypothetical protein